MSEMDKSYKKYFTFVFVTVLFLFKETVMANEPPVIDYKTFYFDQKIDHFGFANDDTYPQRYLVADQYWDKDGGGPIFFYAGNEGSIDWFCNNTGIMWTWAPEFGAMLVFAEHRYYGESKPFGNSSYKDAAHLNYLTAEQALADYAVLLSWLKETTPGASQIPVIAFGGSYGGMLAAWIRMKYPNIILGSLASSAPIWNFGDLVPCGSHSKIVTKNFKMCPNCAENIRKSWGVIDELGKTEGGRSFLSETLGLCSPLTFPNQTTGVKNWLYSVWGNMAMVNYPYEANFVEHLPAWPVKVICQFLRDPSPTPHDLVKGLRQAMNVYFNFTGRAGSCYKTSNDATANLGDRGWGVQSCTEMVMPKCDDGIHDMFEPSPWNLADRIHDCQTRFNFTPRPQWIIEQYGGKEIGSHSNIIFSNGKLDPWSGGGVMVTINEFIVTIVIDNASHHLDLRSPNPNDPPSVLSAREKEKATIRGWIKNYWEDENEPVVAPVERGSNIKHDDSEKKDEDDYQKSRPMLLLILASLMLSAAVVLGLFCLVTTRPDIKAWVRQQKLKPPSNNPADDDYNTTLL